MTSEQVNYAQYWVKKTYLALMRRHKRETKTSIKTTANAQNANNNQSDDESDNEDL